MKVLAFLKKKLGRKKLHHFSVTGRFCRCGWPGFLPSSDEVEVKFDRTWKMCFLRILTRSGEKVSLVIYHCPICGGVLSELQSTRSSFGVPVAELKRLGGLLAGVGTIEAAVDRFGTPDFQSFAENKSVEPKVGDSGRIQARLRKIVYSGLSSWVDVALIETVDRGVHIAFLPKKTGRPQ